MGVPLRCRRFVLDIRGTSPHLDPLPEGEGDLTRNRAKIHLQLTMSTDMTTDASTIDAARENEAAPPPAWAAWNLTAITLLGRCFCSKCSR